MPLITLIATALFTIQSPTGTIVGNVRVRAISPTLVRIELKGPEGFEDRKTFTVVDRGSYIEEPQVEKRGGETDLVFKNFQVVVPARLRSTLTGVQVLSPSGQILYTAAKEMPKQSFLPGPADPIPAYEIADNPRLIPPGWGATPPPKGNTLFPETSGWDTGNDSPDLYVFIPGAGGYQTLRKDFLDLTGKIPMPPRWAFGFWDSRYYVYTDKTALATIDEYRKRGFPIDGFVVDTNWRVNGSHGYAVEKSDFPDMAGFIREAHARKVHLMYNDHPEPVAEGALDPKELAYRTMGLDSLLDLGADVWWYDRNWSTHLHEPMPGISKEVWGQRLYHDITQAAKPDVRPMIMSNVEGIDNGIRNGPPHPAGHRYPIMWTGDTTAVWPYLVNGIANGVDAGVNSLLPYVNEDLGGHIGRPTPELYVRYLQYGAFSPIMRVHCTMGQDRHPWSYGKEAEDIARDYIKLRYRLLPTLYSAARRAYDDGTPILRRCDLEWPQFKEADDNQQFLFGDDILVAPMNSGKQPPAKPLPVEMLHTADGNPGIKGEYFANADLKGRPAFTRTDPAVRFVWNDESPRKGFPRENFSVRWSGKLGPIPETGEYMLGAKSDDGARLYLNGKRIIDRWLGRPSTEDLAPVRLEKGKTYAIRLEYMQLGGDADAALTWVKPSEIKKVAGRSVWIPPGEWEDAWTGEVLRGPKTVQVECDLKTMPLFVRGGGIVFLESPRDYADQKPNDPLTIDAYAPTEDGVTERTLYEDDGISNGYLNGAGQQIKVRMTRSGSQVTIEVLPAEGSYPGRAPDRVWIVRLHVPGHAAPNAMPFLGRADGAQEKRLRAPIDRGGQVAFKVGNP